MRTWWVRVSPARMKARVMATIWVVSSSRRDGTRSATSPPNGARMNTGIRLQKDISPSMAALPVSRYTSQLRATICIQVPIRETSWPLQNRR